MTMETSFVPSLGRERLRKRRGNGKSEGKDTPRKNKYTCILNLHEYIHFCTCTCTCILTVLRHTLITTYPIIILDCFDNFLSMYICNGLN